MHLPVDYRTIRFCWLRDSSPCHGIDLQGVCAGGGILVGLLSPAGGVLGLTGAPQAMFLFIPIAFGFSAVALLADMWPLPCGILLLLLSSLMLVALVPAGIAALFQRTQIEPGAILLLGVYATAVVATSARHVARWRRRARSAS